MAKAIEQLIEIRDSESLSECMISIRQMSPSAACTAEGILLKVQALYELHYAEQHIVHLLKEDEARQVIR